MYDTGMLDENVLKIQSLIFIKYLRNFKVKAVKRKGFTR